MVLQVPLQEERVWCRFEKSLQSEVISSHSSSQRLVIFPVYKAESILFSGFFLVEAETNFPKLELYLFEAGKADAVVLVR